MPNAFVLMTALPPTVGHANLIEFARDLVWKNGGMTYVIVTTQPDEPFVNERVRALEAAFYDDFDIEIWSLHQKMEQNPKAPGFWDMWVEIMRDKFGMQPGDLFVSSEPYGKTMAELTGAIFMPYDPQRELYYTKATLIREYPKKYFGDVLPEFQPNLMKRVTVFGAESTGKTTLSRELSYRANGHWFFEYARPYLEAAENVITKESMHAIHIGQRAIQEHGERMRNKPWIVQDTDLFTTAGYWAFPHWQDVLGQPPSDLVMDAQRLKSDLYLITKSNIPFEPDPLRYGGDKREGDDDYWIGVAEKYGLNYKVLGANDLEHRITEAMDLMDEEFNKTASLITYNRAHND